MTATELWQTRVRGTPRRRVVGESVATFAFGCILIALGLVGTSGVRYVEELPSRWIFALPLAASCLLLLAKRTHPGTAAVLGTLVFAADVAIGGSIGVIVAYFDLVYCVAVWGRRAVLRRAEVVVGTSVALSGAVCFIVTGDLRATALVLTIAFTLLATPLWWGRSVRSQTELARIAAARAEDLHQLAQLREVEVLREERTRMAHELHDALAGNLAAIGIHAEAALAGSRTAPGTRGSDDHPSLVAIREASVAAADELRAMVHILRAGDDERTAPARLAEIDGVLERARHRGLRLDTHLPETWPTLSAAVDHAAYRIVQEALTNAAKHSPESAVQLSIEARGDAIRISVDTALSGSAPGRGGGVGLVSMRERATALGGTFTAGPKGGSWRLRASLPLTMGAPGSLDVDHDEEMA